MQSKQSFMTTWLILSVSILSIWILLVFLRFGIPDDFESLPLQIGGELDLFLVIAIILTFSGQGIVAKIKQILASNRTRSVE